MRISPPSLGSSVIIEEGTLAFGNDKNLWLRKKRNDKNTYWTSFFKLDLELGIPRNEPNTYNYFQIEWEIPNFGIFYLTYVNNGLIKFECFDNNNEQLLFANVPLQRFDKLKNQNRIEALRQIVYDFSKNVANDNDTTNESIIKMNQELNRFWNIILNNLSELQLRYVNKNDYDFQAEIDFPLNKTFRPDKRDLVDLDIEKSVEEQDEEPEQPTEFEPSTPQSEFFEPIWRFKTKQEFIDEFGDEWQNKAQWNLSGRMDYLFEKPIIKPNFDPSAFDKKDINTQIEFGIASGENNDWTIFPQMFKKIESEEFKPIWRFKTEQEFIEQFGDEWRRELGWLRGGNNMDYLYGKAVTNPTFDGAYFLARSFDTAEELGIDSGGDNQWFLTKEMFKKIENDQSNKMIGKLHLKFNYDTYLKISENLDRLEINSDEFVWIKPSMYYDNEFFQFLSTDLAREQYDSICKIRLDYEFGVTITFQNPSSDIDFIVRKITSESKFVNAIADVKKYLNNSEFERELNVIALFLQNGIWRDRSIVCDFVSSTPKPKFAVGDKVTKKNNKKRIFTITSITAFDDEQQQWDYDVVEDIDGKQLSYWENQLELAPIEEPLPTECNVDVSLIDSEYVGKFYQANKNRIEALNSNISCLFLEALLSLSNYEKCGDGVEIPMPQPKKEVKEDLLAQIRNLKI
jgi:hypothetical protein